MALPNTHHDNKETVVSILKARYASGLTPLRHHTQYSHQGSWGLVFHLGTNYVHVGWNQDDDNAGHYSVCLNGHNTEGGLDLEHAINRVGELLDKGKAALWPTPQHRSVLQDWVFYLGLRHQGVLLAAVRGCDSEPRNAASKLLVRVLRCAFLNPHVGDPAKAKTFFMVMTDEEFKETSDRFFQEFDGAPLHYVMHLAHAAEIVGYYCPHAPTADRWRVFYRRLVNKLHLNIETKQELDARLNADEHAFKASQDK